MKDRPKLVRVSEEMKQWSGLLEAELSRWPNVTTRPMFGMLGLYRKGRIFGALPVTRCFETPRSVAFRLSQKTPRISKMLQADERIARSRRQEARWIAFELNSAQDINDALKWFDLAYRNCRSKNNSKS